MVVPANVKVEVSGNTVRVEGPKGKLAQSFRPEVAVKYDADKKSVVVSRSGDERESRALHGLYRALIRPYSLRRDRERLEEAAQCLARIEREPGPVEAAQVDVQLPAGEPGGDTVRPGHRQGGLAHSGGAGDRRDGDGGGLVRLAVTDRIEAR